MIPGIKGTPILSELGRIQHKCSDICNCDSLFGELKSNTKRLGLLLHIPAHPSLDKLVFVNCAMTASSTMGRLYVSPVTLSVLQI